MTECQSNLNPFLVKSSLASFISYKTENQQDWLKKAIKMPLQKREHGNPETINSLVETFYTYLFITTHCHIYNLQNIEIGLVGRG